ncbi:transferase hexapeptide (six repeat-containing protein) [Chitinophaga sp. YR573]|uniref:DapH/DapD/GlmU-related protein n=1 Tax=Chitinophaga sp. YR573 TaxID=1881040 RepID=UPI0008B98E4A|nr:DapH/DapD/GlmU-related protein [Chitinophaga sp. YR573]SEW14408.1 transferase hexapeptide (six repeat-containing protein) [Chitinophaga sp. YR573]
MNIIRSLKFRYRKIVNRNTFRREGVKCEGFTINGIIKVINKGKLVIGDNFIANSGVDENPIGGDTVLRLITHLPESELTIGKNVGISNSTIVCWNKITIGDNVVIGGSVKIWDTNFHSLEPVMRNSGADTDIKTDAIVISNNVFIGSSVIILKGVTIGENSVIAAGSVVVKNIPANVIAGGNPCNVIKALNV